MNWARGTPRGFSNKRIQNWEGDAPAEPNANQIKAQQELRPPTDWF
jgi:hypothetical protein